MNTTASVSFRKKTNEDCLYARIDSLSGCRTFRSCQDCLQTEGCRIGANGYCEPNIAPLDGKAISYQQAISQNLAAKTHEPSNVATVQSWTFPAFSVRYCSSNDTVCNECIDNKFWLPPGLVPDSRFCVGAAGRDTVGVDRCVCVANCVRDDAQQVCPPTIDRTPTDGMEHLEVIVLVVILGILTFAFTLAGWCCYIVRSRTRRQPRTATPVARLVSEVETSRANPVTEYVVVVEPPEAVAKL